MDQPIEDVTPVTAACKINSGYVASGALQLGHGTDECLLQTGRKLPEQRQATADMEAAHHHGDARRAKLASKIERARELVRLNPNQPDKAAAGPLDIAHDTADRDDGIHLVIWLDLDI